ncbi:MULTISPECIES: hypothetical protein [unclassified Streptomyces]|uniref:hypothetical protein n=1 Tax=unclassified Streptomyces TaxID=2593676 RepID=UPI002E34B006|nr:MULTISPECIES: hypothetical protein [unclassified Streptomyces]WUC68359.1 hypothetical protein OG861_31220 [Streptomyces sp. NBC_00539]
MSRREAIDPAQYKAYADDPGELHLNNLCTAPAGRPAAGPAGAPPGPPPLGARDGNFTLIDITGGNSLQLHVCPSSPYHPHFELLQ